MKTLSMSAQIIRRMISSGIGFGLATGMGYGVAVLFFFFFYALFIPGTQIDTQPVALLSGLLYGVVFGAILGSISGLLLGIVEGLVISAVTALYFARRHDPKNYRKTIILFTLGTCAMIGMSGTLLVFTNASDLPLIIVAWVIPVFIASVVFYKATQNVANFCLGKLTDNAELSCL